MKFADTPVFSNKLEIDQISKNCLFSANFKFGCVVLKLRLGNERIQYYPGSRIIFLSAVQKRKEWCFLDTPILVRFDQPSLETATQAPIPNFADRF